MRDPNHEYAHDPRTSEELLLAHREARGKGETNDAMGILQYRGGETEFNLGKTLAESAIAEDRAIGARLLGQLGWDDQTFHQESISILIRLLEDHDAEVIMDAAFALGFRKDPQAIPALITKASHEDPDVRWGVVSGLSGHDDERAVQMLITLCRDSDYDVRNWAVFGLGSLTEMDSPEIREALYQAIADEDPEIRGEALIGLAVRKDPRVLQPLKKELSAPFYGSWSLEAAELMACLS